MIAVQIDEKLTCKANFLDKPAEIGITGRRVFCRKLIRLGLDILC